MSGEEEEALKLKKNMPRGSWNSMLFGKDLIKEHDLVLRLLCLKC